MPCLLPVFARPRDMPDVQSSGEFSVDPPPQDAVFERGQRHAATSLSSGKQRDDEPSKGKGKHIVESPNDVVCVGEPSWAVSSPSLLKERDDPDKQRKGEQIDAIFGEPLDEEEWNLISMEVERVLSDIERDCEAVSSPLSSRRERDDPDSKMLMVLPQDSTLEAMEGGRVSSGGLVEGQPQHLQEDHRFDARVPVCIISSDDESFELVPYDMTFANECKRRHEDIKEDRESIKKRLRSSVGRRSKSEAQPEPRSAPSVKRRKSIFWTTEEEVALEAAMKKIPADSIERVQWKKILELGVQVYHHSRRPIDLKDKWRNMNKGKVDQHM